MNGGCVKRMLTAGMAALVVLVSGCSTSATAGQPTATATTTAIATAQPSQAEQIKALEIKAAQSNEALGTDIINKMSAWLMAGATPENYKNRDRTISVEDYAARLAGAQGDVYGPAIFGPDYAKDPVIAHYVATMIKLNAQNIVYYIKTFDPKLNAANVEPFKEVMIADGIASAAQTPDGLKLVIDYHHEANAGKNFIDSSILDGLKESMIVTLAKSGDRYIATFADDKRR